MARSQANLQFGIAGGLRGLSRDAKLLYTLGILCEPTVNQAGLGALRISRWARELEFTVAETEKAMQELDEQRYVLVDPETEEILVRTLMRNDGVSDQPNVLWAAVRAAVRAESPRLRKALADELRRLPLQRPDKTTKTGRTFVHADPHAVADELDPPPPDDPDRTPEPVDNPVDNTPGEPFENPSTTHLEPIKSEGFENPSRTPGGGGGGGGGGSTCPVDGDLGGRAHTREATPHDPPCEKPCRRCQAARLAAEETERAAGAALTERRAADLAARRACRLCDADGWTWHDPNAHRHGVTNTRCDHQPHLRSVTA
jgi:hypothetical protein